MKKTIYSLLTLGVISFNVQSATIDIMYTATFGHYWQNYYASNQQFMIFSQADYYLLDDGSTWDSGAGWHPNTDSTLLSVNIVGTTINYNFNNPTDDILFQNTDYNAGDHSSQGVLGVTGPLTITAELGSSSATMSGYTEIISNIETWYGEPRFNYYSANVGDLVYFEVDYILGTGTVFDENLFNQDFSYNLTGHVDFTRVVPIPPAFILFISGFLTLLSAGKYRSKLTIK